MIRFKKAFLILFSVGAFLGWGCSGPTLTLDPDLFRDQDHFVLADAFEFPQHYLGLFWEKGRKTYGESHRPFVLVLYQKQSAGVEPIEYLSGYFNTTVRRSHYASDLFWVKARDGVFIFDPKSTPSRLERVRYYGEPSAVKKTKEGWEVLSVPGPSTPLVKDVMEWNNPDRAARKNLALLLTR